MRQIKDNSFICADALDVIRDIGGGVALVLTDPPYPDYHTELYGYSPEPILALDKLNCRQLVFWSAKSKFPLSYTAIHIWDKITGAADNYERIFERNGQRKFRLFRGHRINSTVSANFARDDFTGHPSQKPIALIKKLVSEYSSVGDLVFDPFCGSGPVALACHALHRRFICCDKNQKWIDIAEKRHRELATQQELFGAGDIESGATTNNSHYMTALEVYLEWASQCQEGSARRYHKWLNERLNA